MFISSIWSWHVTLIWDIYEVRQLGATIYKWLIGIFSYFYLETIWLYLLLLWLLSHSLESEWTFHLMWRMHNWVFDIHPLCVCVCVRERESKYYYTLYYTNHIKCWDIIIKKNNLVCSHYKSKLSYLQQTIPLYNIVEFTLITLHNLLNY